MVSIGLGILFTIPSYPEGDSLVNNCLGRNEVYFDFDYFVSGGISRSKEYCSMGNQIGKFFCQFCLVGFVFLSSNICEIFLMTKIYFAVKEQTKSVESLLTKSAFEERKR